MLQYRADVLACYGKKTFRTQGMYSSISLLVYYHMCVVFSCFFRLALLVCFYHHALLATALAAYLSLRPRPTNSDTSNCQCEKEQKTATHDEWSDWRFAAPRDGRTLSPTIRAVVAGTPRRPTAVLVRTPTNPMPSRNTTGARLIRVPLMPRGIA